MENDNLHLKSTSDEQPAWIEEVNLDEMLSKYGPEGCHEIADKLIEIANEDMENALEQANKESINKIEWFEHPEEPFLNTAVVVELDNEELGIAQLDENYNRKCWLIQGTGKMFWRSFIHGVKKWRWMTGDEMVEYHENRTLKLIENDEKTEI